MAKVGGTGQTCLSSVYMSEEVHRQKEVREGIERKGKSRLVEYELHTWWRKGEGEGTQQEEMRRKGEIGGQDF